MIENIQTSLQEIRKDFFRFRNGIVAQSLRGLYSPEVMVYGLTVPQFMDIAKKFPNDLELGISLWEDKKSRESRLLSLYIIPPEKVDKDLAVKMIEDVRNSEEADFLAFRILRKLPFAQELFNELNEEKNDSNDISSYCVLMLGKNLGINNSAVNL